MRSKTKERNKKINQAVNAKLDHVSFTVPKGFKSEIVQAARYKNMSVSALLSAIVVPEIAKIRMVQDMAENDGDYLPIIK